MRASLFSIALLSGISGVAASTTCVNDACQKSLQKYGGAAAAYCVLFNEISEFSNLPSFMTGYSAAAISSACSCVTATSTSSTKKSTSTAKATSTSSSKCVVASTTIVSVSTVTAAPSTVYSTIVSTVVNLSTLVSTDVFTTTVVAPTVTAYITVPTTVTSYSTATSVSVLSTCPGTTSSTTSSSAVTSSSSTPAPTTTGTLTTSVPCTATVYSQIAPAVAACTSIVLQDIYAPSNSTIALTGLKAGTVVTFAGKTTFGFTNISTFDPITIGGAGITIQGAPGHVIDGNGQAYWDGIGSNGGVPKPNHFIAMSKVTANSVIKDLNIINYPVHCFSISSCSNVIIDNINLDNSAGNAPNNVSNGLPAGHNSDGFDLSSCTNFLLTNSFVNNQDDCVAVTSGNNVTVSNMWCKGGHGMSIGSVGGKSNNNVTNIVFKDSQIIDSTNGPRIKSNYNTTGFISNITYSNILVSNIETYGIDVQQDYLNGGPTGTPTNGVIISNLLFSNVTGTAVTGAQDYYILCGNGSCSNFVFDNVNIVGGSIPASCNYPSTGCPGV